MTSQIGSEFDYFGAISAYIVDVKKPATSCPYVFFFNGKMGQRSHHAKQPPLAPTGKEKAK
jgi:hypothetical protein